MNVNTLSLPRINGVLLADAKEALSVEELRQRACAELFSSPR